MGLLKYRDFLAEDEKIKLDKELREYTLSHVKDDRFILERSNFYKEFSVLPYKREILEDLKEVHSLLVDAIESMKVQDLYKAVTESEKIPYPYGKIYSSEYTLSSVPELTVSLDAEQQQALASSEREFLLNNFSQLGKSSKDFIIETLRERAEVICCVIEALFYYTRTIDKDNFYEGMSSSEILEEYEKQVKDASEKAQFSYEGPFSETEGESEITEETRTAFWHCEKNMKKFFIQATISPKELQSEENVGGTKGLKFSLLSTDDKNPASDYAYFNTEDLESRIKLFYNNILKK